MQVVKGDELSENGSNDVISSLRGHVAGLQITGAGNGVLLLLIPKNVFCIKS